MENMATQLKEENFRNTRSFNCQLINSSAGYFLKIEFSGFLFGHQCLHSNSLIGWSTDKTRKNGARERDREKQRPKPQ